MNDLAQRFEKEGKRVKVCPETAQIYIDEHQGVIADRYDFQNFIMKEEIKRIHEIQRLKQENDFDIILTDRTFLDNFVYIYWSITNCHTTKADLISNVEKEIKLSQELYDVVVFFDTMIIEDKNFADYNTPDLIGIFKHTIHSVYKGKYIHYPNNIEFEKDIDIFLEKYIK
jgi:hypothetical protein